MPTFASPAARPWLVLGCGYTGERLVRRLLAAGARVTATRRDPEVAAATGARLAAGIAAAADRLELRAADTAAPDSVRAACVRDAVVVHTAPPRDLESAAAEGRALAGALATAGAHRLVYVSSTGVYAPAAGAWVDEDFPLDPAGHGVARLAAEGALLSTAHSLGLSAIALRAAAIYGPGRGVAPRIRAGTYRIVGDGAAHVCRIHVEDLVTAIVAAGTIDASPHAIYNVADDEPTTARDYADAVAAALGMAPPPSLPLGAFDPAAAVMLTADRRIANGRLKRALGVALRYPSFRDSLAEESP